ncbi:uncharacterized protein K452DRAFT_297701 [Aplosporella prunicola CBS 121167]|uniref:BTB domain-containing protein n=1 Tax=Aplosporella prunicola CBS 121167 TaxID=1176127 RepID=A0A6A6BEC1_9PEZI|nr:uncharacterized protein K452DRAFT_297701 [Aplosporella prunicola CBS 121167]KAF2142406.1 hypothetical protein K452DRAFT_297701 [Aplosporella prunicola CBS 121167]
MANKGNWEWPNPLNIARIDQSMITLLIGPEEKAFNIHQALLCYWSRYFCNALSGPFKESQKENLKVPDVEVEVFEFAFNWLYTTNLSNELFRDEGILAAKLYVFADYYDVREMRNCLMNLMYEEYNVTAGDLPGYDLVLFAFEYLPQNSMFCRFLLDNYTCNFAPDHDKKTPGDIEKRDRLPLSFLMPLMLQLAEETNGRDPRKKLKNRIRGLQYYIEHAEEEPQATGGDQEGTTAADRPGLVKLK